MPDAHDLEAPEVADREPTALRDSDLEWVHIVNDHVTFRIPAAFVLARVLPTPGELAYGYRHGWIGDRDVITIALAMYEAGPAPSVIETLGLLLADESPRVATLIDEVGESAGSAARAWLFLALAWLHDGDGDALDPYRTVESLYADFGYPPAVAGFVRFMPAPPGAATGLTPMNQRWRAYLAAEADWFRARRSADRST